MPEKESLIIDINKLAHDILKHLYDNNCIGYTDIKLFLKGLNRTDIEIKSALSILVDREYINSAGGSPNWRRLGDSVGGKKITLESANLNALITDKGIKYYEEYYKRVNPPKPTKWEEIKRWSENNWIFITVSIILALIGVAGTALDGAEYLGKIGRLFDTHKTIEEFGSQQPKEAVIFAKNHPIKPNTKHDVIKHEVVTPIAKPSSEFETISPLLSESKIIGQNRLCQFEVQMKNITVNVDLENSTSVVQCVYVEKPISTNEDCQKTYKDLTNTQIYEAKEFNINTGNIYIIYEQNIDSKPKCFLTLTGKIEDSKIKGTLNWKRLEKENSSTTTLKEYLFNIVKNVVLIGK